MPTEGNYLCPSCELAMKPKKNGIYVEEHRGYDLPYKIWMADLLACPLCGREVVSGFANQPAAEHYQADYASWRVKVSYHLREWSAKQEHER